jgi:hypothetical protein
MMDNMLAILKAGETEWKGSDKLHMQGVEQQLRGLLQV